MPNTPVIMEKKYGYGERKKKTLKITAVDNCDLDGCLALFQKWFLTLEADSNASKMTLGINKTAKNNIQHA